MSAGPDVVLPPLKRALLRIEQLEAQAARRINGTRDPIAIVGIGCRFPGHVRTLDDFWRLLDGGEDATIDVPSSRWDPDAWYDPRPGVSGKIYTRRGGFVDDIDRFDPQFFGIAPREASSMDPQQRLLLEVAWEALENAGQAPSGLTGSRTGVFVGLCTADYAALQLDASDVSPLDAYFASGTAHSVAAGRLSYLLGLRGPSLAVDTACSSSLVAVHLACQSLRAGECDVAIAGGVNAILSPQNSIALCQAAMLSADGRCKSFDESADGYGRSEGCGIVILKRLPDARASRDHIWAVVRGSAVNQDGPSSGLTAPNGSSQQSVIREALANGGVDPGEVSYVEAHGTGTRLGDPIEVQALAAVFGDSHSTAAPLLVGSVKSNIGHAEAAAGIAGVIKVVLAMRHGAIPAHLHLRTPNRHIPWAEIPLNVPTTTIPWKAAVRRVAGVSSFGFSGTNAHVVIEESPAVEASSREVERPRHVLCLSARSEAAVRTLAARYAAHLDRHADDIGNVCFTANAGRAHREHRVALPADDLASLHRSLRAVAEGTGPAIVARESPDEPRVAFLFTGQGGHYPGMARCLYETQPTFRRAFDRCAAVLDGVLPHRLAALVFAPSGSREAALLDQTRFTQPALVAVEYALAELWQSWGVRPAAVMGHSVGEFAAAVVAGACPLEDGLRLVAERARLMQSLPPGGGMTALFTDEAQVAHAIEAYTGRVSLAAINGPEHVVISGSADHLQAVAGALARRGVRSARLNVSHAFHSPLMDAILDDFERAAAATTFGRPTVPLISNLTGAVAGTDDLADPTYWRRHVREPVRFAAGVARLRQARCNVLIEMGPSPVLLAMIARGWADDHLLLPSLRGDGSDWRVLIDSVAQAYVRGVPIDWAGFDRDYDRRRVLLPTYPFERTRCWIDLPQDDAAKATRARRSTTGHTVVGMEISTPLPQRIFTPDVSRATLPFLADHVVHGITVLPTTAFVEIARAAGTACLGTDRVAVEDLSIHALPLPAHTTCSTQLVVEPVEDDVARFRLFAQHESADGSQWTEHASGGLRRADIRPGDAGAARLEDVRARCTEHVDVERFYDGMHARGLQFGQAFRTVRALARRDGEAIADIELSSSLQSDAGLFPVHPVLLDGAIQIMAAAVPGFVAGDLTASIYMPVGLDRYLGAGVAGTRVVSRAWLAAEQGGHDTLCGHVDVYTPGGDLVAQFHGLRMKRADAAGLARAVSGERETWAYALRWSRADSGPAPQPDPALTPSAVAASIERHWSLLCTDHGVDVYDRLNPELDKLSEMLVVSALRELGWNPAAGDSVSLDSVVTALGVQVRHRRLVGRFLEVLCRIGVLVPDGDVFSVVAELPRVDARAAAADALQRHANQTDEITILTRCGLSLAGALRGTVDPLELLFPGGDIEGTARIYKASPLARTFNGAVGAAVERIVTALPSDRPLRVLEIGGGTGGTTMHLLDRLPAGRTEYVFTDIGQAFVAKAARAFTRYPFVRFELLDIESDPAQQGFTTGSFDLIVASNVIHATRDVAVSLAHARQLLAPGGWLLLLEGTRPQSWLDLTFGLTDGWWRFTDVRRRSYPLMSRQSWLPVLAESGFGEASALPAVDSGGAASQNALFIARAAAAHAQQTDECWLVFAHEDDDLAARLGVALAARGGQVLGVRPGAAWVDGERHYQIDPEIPEHFVRLLGDVRHRTRSPLRGVIYLWPTAMPDEELDTAGVRREQRLGARGALALVQTLVDGSPGEVPPRLWLVSRGTQRIAGHPAPVAAVHAPLWGLGRTIRMEHPDLHCVNVDLDLSDEDQYDLLLAEVLGAGDAREVAFRGRERLVATLVPAGDAIASAAQTPGSAPRAYVGLPGDLTSVRVVHAPRRRPGAGEVEVGVRAAGLNFRDVLNAIGMRHDAESLGGEFAGVVLSVGEGVASVRPGDAVMGLARGTFSNVTIASDAHLVPLPPGVDFVQACTIPIAFLTAHYALTVAGRLRRGDRVLVHAAAGGVGLAAVQLAQVAGAAVFATAGTPDKRAYLRAHGVEHVMDSRSLAFADEISAATDGQGVDLVLGAITGDIRRRSLGLLGPGGRLLDLGHAENNPCDTATPARCVDIDLSVRLLEDAGLARRLFADLVPMFADGRLEPLPATTFALEHAADAFQYMARAKHVGKIAIVPPAAAAEPTIGPWVPRPDATYLITGGLAGLGPLVAEWLVRRGARHLALIGRSAPDDGVQGTLDRLRREGAAIRIWQADVADEPRMRDVIDDIDRHMPPLRGVFHLAGVLDDGVLLQQTWARFEAVMRPKMEGAWVMHRLTRRHDLERFVLFSSVSALFGSPAQANHSAANAFLDALAHYRQSLGLPALSINWGVWSGAGAAAARRADRRTAVLGVKPIAPEDGLRMLEQVMPIATAQIAAVPLDVPLFVHHFPRGAHPGLVTSLAAGSRPAIPHRVDSPPGAGATQAQTTRTPHSAEPTVVPFRQQLSVLPASRQRAAVQSHIQTSAGRVLGLAPAGFDRRTPLSELGLDSLMAVELRNALAASLERPLPATLLFDYPTVEALTDYLCGRVLELDDVTGSVVTGTQSVRPLTARDLLDRVESMSDDDVEGLLESHP